MANSNREDTIRRIRNLLELAGNNPSEHEAQAAALAAQRLIAANNVLDSELMLSSEEVIREIESGNYKGNPWAVRLAIAIADNFRCRMYLTSDGWRSYYSNRMHKTEQRVVFMGYETDAMAATETFNRLLVIGNKLANKECRKARRKYGTANGVKNSFLLGFVAGIRNELEKQCTALVLVRPKEVDDYAEEVTRDFRSASSKVRNAYYGNAYDSGMAAGRDSMRAGNIDGQRALSA